MAKDVRNSGKYDIEECNRYIQALQHQRWEICKRVEQLCQQTLGVQRSAQCQLIYEQIAALNEVD